MPPLKVDVQVSEGPAAPVATHAKAPPASASAAELEVDYDHDITRLYEAITNEDWDAAIGAVRSAPSEARTWVVRHHPDGTIMWRFLPLHSACARQPPVALVTALLEAYRPAAGTCDDQGLFPLHYAAGNQASSAVVKTLLLNHPDATSEADPTGMLPLHYLAKWGPSDKLCLDILLLTNQKAVLEKTEDGETPLELALEGDYDEELRDAVVTTLRALSGETAKEVEVEEEAAEDVSEVASDVKSMKDSVDDPTVRKALSLEREARSIGSESKAVAPRAAAAPAVETTSLLADLQKIHSREREIATLKDERKAAAAAHEQHLATERAALQAEILLLQEEVAKLTATNDDLTTERSNKDEFLRYIEGRLAEKDYEMLNVQKVSDALAAENADLKTRYAALKATSDANDVRFTTLQQSTSTLLAEHGKIAAAVAKRDALFKAATQRRQKKMQELINMEVELTKEAVADEREGDGSYLNGAIKRQAEEMALVRTTVEEAMAGVVVPDAKATEEEI